MKFVIRRGKTKIKPRPCDMWPLGARTLQVSGFELSLKEFETRRFKVDFYMVLRGFLGFLPTLTFSKYNVWNQNCLT